MTNATYPVCPECLMRCDEHRCVQPVTKQTSLTKPIRSRCYLEGDFRVGAHAAFKLAMTSIFNHKQILAAEILENQTKESQSPSDGIQNSENTAAGGTAEEAVLRGAIPIDETNNASDPESTEALRQKIQAAKDAKAALDDLCNDVKFVPDLEGQFVITRMKSDFMNMVFSNASHNEPTVTDSSIRICSTNRRGDRSPFTVI